MKPHALAFSIVALALVLTVSPARADETTAAKPLYDRLGGLYNIAAVVDDFIERLYVNETHTAKPAIAGARNQARKAGLKVQLATLVCQATGGPCKYTGQNMKDSHARLNISEKDWDAMAAEFKATLDKFKVPEAEQKELFAIVGSTKADIVATSTAKK
jgi:hemoglobin